jgi:hypothetical protein
MDFKIFVDMIYIIYMNTHYDFLTPVQTSSYHT